MITVVNLKNHKSTDNDVYVGRGSPLGNPYTHIKTKYTQADFIVETRYQAIEKYKEYLSEKIKLKDKSVCDELNRIWKLAKSGDINLCCYCSPKLACHGDVIKSIIQSKLK